MVVNKIMNDLIENIEKIHTTELGNFRISRNLAISEDPVEFCKKCIMNSNVDIKINGKNYYATLDNYVIVINKYSYTLITAHKLKK